MRVDDDIYIHGERLDRFLSKLNHSEALYIGKYLLLITNFWWNANYFFRSTDTWAAFGLYLKNLIILQTHQIPVKLILSVSSFLQGYSFWGTGAIVTGCSSCRHQWLLSDSNPGPTGCKPSVLTTKPRLLSICFLLKKNKYFDS